MQSNCAVNVRYADEFIALRKHLFRRCVFRLLQREHGRVRGVYVRRFALIIGFIPISNLADNHVHGILFRYADNGEVRYCPYCGAPFYHVVDVYQEWTRSYRMAEDEKWYTEEQFAERAAEVEEECRREYRRWLEERMEENK